MLHVEINTWEYAGYRCSVKTYTDPERRRYQLNIYTADGFESADDARAAAVEWLEEQHGGHWNLMEGAGR